MSRDIKFAIGLKRENGEVFELILTIDELLDKGCKQSDCEVLWKRQYTGMKDKNGVEIYEGDILALNNEYAKDMYNIYKVIYLNDLAKFMCSAAYEEDLTEVHSVVKYDDGNGRYMVVGNIHQTHELLYKLKGENK